MKAYLINTDNMKAVGRFASIKSAEKAGAGAKYNFDIITQDDDMARFTGAELVKLFDNHRGTRAPIKKFKSKQNGALRIMDALEEVIFKVIASPGKAKGAKQLVREALLEGPKTKVQLQEITGKCSITVSTALSDLKNPKYAGKEGALKIVRNNEEYSIESNKTA